ncbi:MAG: glycoside hydrolase family 73 protein [Paraclostridium sp.]
MTKKSSIIVVSLLITFLTSMYMFIKVNSLKEIKKYDIDVSKYIQYVDEVSKSKVQVNWKEVVSIIAVKNNNKIKGISEDEIQNIASLFIVKDDENYKILPFEEVLSSIPFNEKEVTRAYDYLNDLKYYGLKSERLSPEGKYIKFIDSIKDSAIKNYETYNILPSITIAQAILESNWGESRLSSEFNNLFGIKAHSSWGGESVSVETSEHYNTIIVDEFRAYKSKGDSIKDHAKFLSENPRYKGVFEKNTYIEQAAELQESGYSTVSDENGNLTYKKLLVQIIQQYNLQLIDSYVQQKKMS